ncbi:MAG TPA: ATP-grasp domain-containing protein [Vitreimonas sp.]|nr:ATP-grasp domain-containing protein [Vitreimonas sp.]
MDNRIAIVCMSKRWAGAARTAHALTLAGAEVCVVAPPDSYGAKTRFKFADLILPASAISSRLSEIVRLLAEEFQAHCVLAGDDAAFAALARLIGDADANKLGPAAQAMLARSLPSPETAALLASDSAFILAQQDRLGCMSPRTIGAPSADRAIQFAKEFGFPVVLKRDGFASGLGVHICRDEAALRTAIAKAARGHFVLQEFIRGPVYGATVAGVRGRALAAIAFEKHRQFPLNGPTSVARFDPRPDILAHARGLFEACSLNGYAGFDYVIDEKDRARFIEINPRIMPTGHFNEHFGVDLTGAFMAGVRGAPAPPVREPLNRFVALFPNEWTRDPDSSFLLTAVHDVPWHDPPIFAAMIDKALEMRMRAEPEPFGDASRIAMLWGGATDRTSLFGD